MTKNQDNPLTTYRKLRQAEAALKLERAARENERHQYETKIANLVERLGEDGDPDAPPPDQCRCALPVIGRDARCLLCAGRRDLSNF